MNLHFTPSFNIDRLCKTASVLLFLVSHRLLALIMHTAENGNFTLAQVYRYAMIDCYLLRNNIVVTVSDSYVQWSYRYKTSQNIHELMKRCTYRRAMLLLWLCTYLVAGDSHHNVVYHH